MKKLVIIGANDFQNQLIKKANSLGYETHVFAWEDGAVGKKNAAFFYPISITEKEQILEICRKIKPVGICSIASDLAVTTVNYVAEALGLPCNKTIYNDIQTNKYRMRQALSSAGLSCPKFVLANKNTDATTISDFSFPIIVKPTDRSGSRCIMKLNSADGLEDAINSACDVSFEHKAIVEEFIDGEEYSMEMISYKGVHCYLATTKKHTTGSPHFIETGHEQPSGLPDEILQKAITTITAALNALYIENGASHSEFKVSSDGEIKIIEIGARMGGDCIGSDLVQLSTGNDYVKMVIDVCCGVKPTIVKTDCKHKASVKFVFTKEDLAELEIIKNSNPDIIYRVSDMNNNNINYVSDSSTRVGYYICVEKGTP